jgi:3-dehydroquinate synthase
MMTPMILVGRGLAQRPRKWIKGLPPGTRLMLVSEPKVWRLHGARVAAALRRAGFQTSRHLLPSGEPAKTWAAVSRLLKAMLDQGLGRDSALVALGGGSVTDSAGFAAAVYMRGIPWVSLPTTLLGQVDSGIGGKTAIDLAEGKNLAGAFHQPLAAVCDTDFLSTLPRRERLCGLAEAVKLGMVRDPGLLAGLRRDWPRLRDGEPAALERWIRRAAAGKASVVSRDPREAKGPREILNFGHTVGHALEAAAGLGPLRHGEAVACGMRAALRLSQAHAGLPARMAADLEAFLKGIPLPRLRLREAAVLGNLRRDKKARRGRLRFVLLQAVGRPVVVDSVPERSVREAVRFILKELR